MRGLPFGAVQLGIEGADALLGVPHQPQAAGELGLRVVLRLGRVDGDLQAQAPVEGQRSTAPGRLPRGPIPRRIVQASSSHFGPPSVILACHESVDLPATTLPIRASPNALLIPGDRSHHEDRPEAEGWSGGSSSGRCTATKRRSTCWSIASGQPLLRGAPDPARHDPGPGRHAAGAACRVAQPAATPGSRPIRGLGLPAPRERMPCRSAPRTTSERQPAAAAPR